MTDEIPLHKGELLTVEIPLYKVIAGLVDARLRCIEGGVQFWESRHEDNIVSLCKNHLPSGSGWDHGTEIDLDKSTGEKLVLMGAFHHMDEGGGYDGWSDHTVTVTPSLQFGFNLSISGRDKNGIKEYLVDLFREDLSKTGNCWL